MNKNIEKYKKNKGYNSNNKVFEENKPIIENHDNMVSCFFEDKNDKGYTKAIITITHPHPLNNDIMFICFLFIPKSSFHC